METKKKHYWVLSKTDKLGPNYCRILYSTENEIKGSRIENETSISIGPTQLNIRQMLISCSVRFSQREGDSCDA